MIFCNVLTRILQSVTSNILQWETSATSNEGSLQGVTSNFLRRVVFAMNDFKRSNEHRATLQQITSDFIKQ